MLYDARYKWLRLEVIYGTDLDEVGPGPNLRSGRAELNAFRRLSVQHDYAFTNANQTQTRGSQTSAPRPKGTRRRGVANILGV